MGEGIASDDGFVGLHGHAGDFAQQLAGGEEMFGGDGRFVGIAIVANAHGHDDLFERGVAGALSDTVDGAFDLARSSGDGGHGVGDGHAEIVVAVGGDGDVLDSLHAAADGCDQLAELGGHGVADRVRNIERGRAGLDDCFEHLAEEFRIGARSIFGREFDIGTERFGEGDGFAGLRETLLARDAQLVLQVNVGGGEEDVNARMGCVFQSFPGAFDIRTAGAGESRNDGAADDAATALTAAKSPSEAMGNPASITSTPRRSS